jgi:hypothetical protein
MVYNGIRFFIEPFTILPVGFAVTMREDVVHFPNDFHSKNSAKIIKRLHHKTERKYI